MVGDSLTEASVRVLTASLTAVGFTDIHIEGKKNRRIEVGNGFGEAPPSGLLTIAAMQKAGVSPDVWVIELGTNDLGGYKDAQGFGDIVDKAMALIPPTLPLVWVNTFRTDYPDRAKLFNLVLQGRIGSRRRSLVADWYSIASAPDQIVLRDDGVHPNAAGVQALSALVVQALQRL